MYARNFSMCFHGFSWGKIRELGENKRNLWDRKYMIYQQNVAFSGEDPVLAQNRIRGPVLPIE